MPLSGWRLPRAPDKVDDVCDRGDNFCDSVEPADGRVCRLLQVLLEYRWDWRCSIVRGTRHEIAVEDGGSLDGEGIASVDRGV